LPFQTSKNSMNEYIHSTYLQRAPKRKNWKFLMPDILFLFYYSIIWVALKRNSKQYFEASIYSTQFYCKLQLLTNYVFYVIVRTRISVFSRFKFQIPNQLCLLLTNTQVKRFKRSKLFIQSTDLIQTTLRAISVCPGLSLVVNQD